MTWSCDMLQCRHLTSKLSWSILDDRWGCGLYMTLGIRSGLESLETTNPVYAGNKVGLNAEMLNLSVS